MVTVPRLVGSHVAAQNRNYHDSPGPVAAGSLTNVVAHPLHALHAACGESPGFRCIQFGLSCIHKRHPRPDLGP